MFSDHKNICSAKSLKNAILFFYLIINFIKPCCNILRCGQIGKNDNKVDYFMLQSCTKSNATAIDTTHSSNLEACKQFAVKRRATSFNFMAPVKEFKNGKKDKGQVEPNCLVYDCPEFNVTAIDQYKSPYHYYSLYTKIMPSTNTTCIPNLGVFLLSDEKLNYTEAVAKCDEYGGILADIITEARTNSIGNIISKSQINNTKTFRAYVGLDDIDQEGSFVSVKGVPLACLPYRAWGPGEPKHKLEIEDCVTIDISKYWKIESCNKKLHFICELLPNQYSEEFPTECTDLSNERAKTRCFYRYNSNEFANNKKCRIHKSGTTSQSRSYSDY